MIVTLLCTSLESNPSLYTERYADTLMRFTGSLSSFNIRVAIEYTGRGTALIHFYGLLPYVNTPFLVSTICSMPAAIS